MAKIFFKSIFVTFLWLIVFINITFFFDIGSSLPLVNATGFFGGPTKYFGVSTLINFFKDFNLRDHFSFMADFQDWLTSFQSNMTQVLSVDFNDAFSYPVNNPADFFVAVWYFIENIFKMIANLVVFIVVIPLWFVIVFFYILAIFKMMIFLASGAYSNDLRPFTYDSIADSVRLFILYFGL